MAEEKTVDQLDQRELFEAAMAPEPPKEEVQPAEPAPAAEPPAPPEPVEPPKEPGVPSWRLREETEARRLAEQRAGALEERLRQLDAHIRQSQQKPAPDFFEKPDEAVLATVARVLQPFAENTRREIMAMGKMVAEARHTEPVVSQAEQAFLKARDDQTLDPNDYEAVVQAPNRYDAVVRWHRRQNVLSSVGDDPAAWFEKQLETRLADPKFQATLLERVRGGAATRPAETRLPPTLSKSTATADNRPPSLGDMSDASIWAHVMKQ